MTAAAGINKDMVSLQRNRLGVGRPGLHAQASNGPPARSIGPHNAVGLGNKRPCTYSDYIGCSGTCYAMLIPGGSWRD